MNTTFMLMNNPIDLVMNLIVDTTSSADQMALEGAIEKYKVDFNAVLNKRFLLQSWSLNSQTFFSFNGTSRFLSSILFCYFISSFLLMIISSKKRATIS